MENHETLIKEEIYNELPDELKKLTENFKGRERDIVLLSSIGVLSNCLPNIYGNYDGDDIYPQLYFVFIAPAASGKGVMNYSRALIQLIHDKIRKDSKRAKQICEKKNRDEKKMSNECPKTEIKIVPANSSTSEIYTYLDRSKFGVIIIESEIDTLSQNFKQDWGNYSDVLRKSFHHEPISLSRKIDDDYKNVEEPRLAMVISGTPDQLKPLIQSTENGLYSRCIIYGFKELSEFKDVFAEKTRNSKIAFEDLGGEIFKLYGMLQALEKPVEFKLTEEQQSDFLKRLRSIRESIIANHHNNFISNLHRHGLIFFRIAMIITAIRNKDQLPTLKEMKCNDTDFKLALSLTTQLLRNSLRVYNSFKHGDLTAQEEEFISSLNDSFTTQEAYILGEKLDITKRTIDDKLSQWQVKRVIKRFKKGHYLKIM